MKETKKTISKYLPATIVYTITLVLILWWFFTGVISIS